MPGLELQGLHKQFGEVVALRTLNLVVESGEFVSLLGPSGCGKTTALRIVAGFERADQGRVLIEGTDITDMPANRRDMGMVFQAYSLFPNMTAQQNVEFGLRIRKQGSAERARRASELLALVGLASATKRYPHQLSGGQQQRVALARALAIEPRVLLLDEPLSALDAKVRVQLREEIRRIQTQLGITTLYVTHDQEEALSVSDRVVVLSQGQIEQVGKPAEIYGEPQTVFVAAFIGTMNRIEATTGTEVEGTVESAGHRLPAEAASRWTGGPRVLMLIRPEVIDLHPLDDGDPPNRDGLEGNVKTRTFLGPVTRVGVTTPVGDLMVDVPSVEALSISIGTRVFLRWDPASPRLIALPDGGQSAAGPATVVAEDELQPA
ncbi:MAG: ABC transporter ATP-binding protein [Chloroflexota bacterium]